MFRFVSFVRKKKLEKKEMKILWFKRHVDLSKHGHASTRGMPYALKNLRTLSFMAPVFQAGLQPNL